MFYIHLQYLINDLERGIKLNKNNKILDRIEELDDDFGMGNEDAEENIKDLLSYLRAKIEIASNGHITAELFFKRLQATVKNSVKIERNEEKEEKIKQEIQQIKNFKIQDAALSFMRKGYPYYEAFQFSKIMNYAFSITYRDDGSIDLHIHMLDTSSMIEKDSML